jgi:phosphatidate cytidylyltransferase
MGKKIATGLGLATFAVLIILDANYFLLAAVGMFGGMGMWEYYQLLRQKNVKPMTVLGILAGESFIVMSFFSAKQGDMLQAGAGFGTVIAFYVLLVLVIQFIQIVNHRERYSILDLSTTVFGSIYIGGFGSLIFPLLGFGHNEFPDSEVLPRLILFLPYWAAYGADVGAYFAGSFLGKTRLFPEISPKKTLEGCIGGVVMSTIGTIVIGLFIKLPFIHGLLLGLIASIAGQIGDLSESAFKREIGVKDSSTIFGSHGGFLDRLDSILFVFPVIYYYFIWFCPWV